MALCDFSVKQCVTDFYELTHRTTEDRVTFQTASFIYLKYCCISHVEKFLKYKS